ncbi:MAG: serine protease [Gammaproteobacteria bacterium]|nr:serine protease [Gammaproteobacteria bacterium]
MLKLTRAVLLLGTLLWHINVLADTNCGWPDSDSLRAVLPVAAEDGSYASGVVFAQNRVLTAAHAIAPDTRVFVGVHNVYRKALVLMVDPVTDLAVLSVDTGSIQPLRIASADPRISEQVWAVGFPRAQAKTTSVGVFQKKMSGALHTSAPIDSGQSGGGLLSCEGGSYRLAGMLRGYGAYFKGGQYVKLENHSVSVAAATIQNFVSQSSIH